MQSRCLLGKGSPDDAVHLFVDVEFGKTAALGVVGHTDGYWLGPLCNRHCNLKKLKGKQNTSVNEKQHPKKLGEFSSTIKMQ